MYIDVDGKKFQYAHLYPADIKNLHKCRPFVEFMLVTPVSIFVLNSSTI